MFLHLRLSVIDLCAELGVGGAVCLDGGPVLPGIPPKAAQGAAPPRGREHCPQQGPARSTTRQQLRSKKYAWLTKAAEAASYAVSSMSAPSA